MQIPDEAARRYPEDYKTIGGSAMERRAFIAGAEWARKEALKEAFLELRSIPYWSDKEGHHGFDLDGENPRAVVLGRIDALILKESR